MQPLDGLLVLDFSTLLPGPLTTLMLAEAGARVVKIERPDRGDEMRSYEPKFGADSVNFVMLNRGKQSIKIDLKAPDAIARLEPLIKQADVLVEQFRPGVMDRLGLGYEAVRNINPQIIYCSITGWGQDGPKKYLAAHDLNYMAETGILGLSRDSTGAPSLPPVLAADIAGGTYPAVINILLALRQRDNTGLGTHLDIAMAESLFTFAYWGLGEGFACNQWPKGGDGLVTGASPRYQIYRTADDKFIAAAPLEEKFWDNFCTLIELPEKYRGSEAPAAEATARVAEIIAQRSADAWQSIFEGHDVCCSVVADLDAAVQDPHFAERGIFTRKTVAGQQTITALPIPIAPGFRSPVQRSIAPGLGENWDPMLTI